MCTVTGVAGVRPDCVVMSLLIQFYEHLVSSVQSTRQIKDARRNSSGEDGEIEQCFFHLCQVFFKRYHDINIKIVCMVVLGRGVLNIVSRCSVPLFPS